MSGFRSLIDGLIKLVMWVACFFTVLMMAHVTVDVFMRVVFNAPLTGTFELASNYYMVSVMFLPLAYVSRYEGQIIVELFTRGLSQTTLQRWDTVVNVITLVYVIAFTLYTGIMAVEQTAIGEVKEMGDDFFDVWPARWILPIAFGMMALYLVMRIHQDVKGSGEPDVPISA